MKVAVNGCCHGELDALYGMLEKIQEEQNIKIDLLICCGDFESLRTKDDLRFFCAPPKYRVLKDFHKYFNGEKNAPVLTLVVGGNHEAPNVLRELYYGGWLAPNIFYLGCSGVVRVGGLRIAGVSGIYNDRHFNFGHFEKPPYDDNTARSAYHVRQFEFLKLHCINEPVDIMLSHDWPAGIYHFGDKESLLRCKPQFREDVEKNCLGSPPSMALLKSMKPSFWFSGHMHVAFAALVPHADGSATRFMALDKVLPNRRSLQVVDIHPKTQAKYIKRPTPQTNISIDLTIEYDIEWLAVLRANQRHIPTSPFRCSCEASYPSDEDRAAVLRSLRRLAAAKQTEESPPASPLTDCKEETKAAANLELKEEENEQNESKDGEVREEEEAFPWPPWTEPPFHDLVGQRRRLLQVIGKEEEDIFDDCGEHFHFSLPLCMHLHAAPSRSCPYTPRNSLVRLCAGPPTPGPPQAAAAASAARAPTVKAPEEEICLDLDEL